MTQVQFYSIYFIFYNSCECMSWKKKKEWMNVCNLWVLMAGSVGKKTSIRKKF